MYEENFTDLVDSAIDLWHDQPEEIAELIHWVLTLDDEERSALLVAYQIIHENLGICSNDS